MNLSFLDDLFRGVGNFGADADQFMKREMPFDSGWAFPAAVAGGAYFGLPALMGGLGEGAAGIGATEGAGAAGGGAEMFTGFKSFLDPNMIMNATEGAEGSIGSGGMNSLLSSLGLGDAGSFAGQEAFQLPMSAYTPEYLDSLAKYQGVDAGNAGLLDRLTSNTEQGLYKQEGLAKQASNQSVTDMLKKQAQQKAIGQLTQGGAGMQQQGQQSPQMQVPQAMMSKGQGVDTVSALLSLLQEKKQLRQPRISLI